MEVSGELPYLLNRRQGGPLISLDTSKKRKNFLPLPGRPITQARDKVQEMADMICFYKKHTELKFKCLGWGRGGGGTVTYLF